ncbi:hypothetical protein AVU32_gp266 [Vibrio phage ValKK3]|uniref:DUF1737 domain-containing protein n=1 Tax=Vibrio phage ValKK3 TaxID=1610855 RepID=A0A0D4DBS4_9CAUD|nr:hypothetical protein AVU32_gp266 [Vibrio phage ValKK3]QBX06093.1 hypothetical protein Va3_139 [Vibrio phage Va3]QNJ54719.1 hypothetical protein vBValMR10Z_178 [Vibrio phage vB_ValM_R10Z]QNJ55105.1 hypothetical protein vBValMR11Z_179 [Vibrio phage vB_ValM_R11Z]URQ03580.1 hypothetical protein PVA23_203 [Vibrio phage PVA23]AJT61107.1 hypothetical protein [Vibrio phage ValKK3]
MQTDYIKYKVVHGNNSRTFEEEVQKLLNEGWELHGSLQVDGFYLYQSLIKKGLD